MICILHFLPFWKLYFHLHWPYSSKEITSFAKNNFFFHYIILLFLAIFFTPLLVDGFFPRVWETTILLKSLIIIPVDLNNVVIRMDSARPPISNSSSPLTNPLWIVRSAPITIGIVIDFMFHWGFFFRSLARSVNFSLCSFSLIFTLRSRWQSLYYYYYYYCCYYYSSEFFISA